MCEVSEKSARLGGFFCDEFLLKQREEGSAVHFGGFFNTH